MIYANHFLIMRMIPKNGYKNVFNSVQQIYLRTNLIVYFHKVDNTQLTVSGKYCNLHINTILRLDQIFYKYIKQ